MIVLFEITQVRAVGSVAVRVLVATRKGDAECSSLGVQFSAELHAGVQVITLALRVVDCPVGIHAIPVISQGCRVTVAVVQAMAQVKAWMED